MFQMLVFCTNFKSLKQNWDKTKHKSKTNQRKKTTVPVKRKAN